MLQIAKHTAFKAIRKIGLPFVTAATASARRRSGLAAPSSRASFLRRLPVGPVLEIGPFNNPAISGDHVSYFDVLDTPGLRRRAASIGMNADRVPSIDFVSPTGDLSVVDRPFAAVLSVHAIEHQPDLIAHLRAVERILVPGGCYHLIVPDKRYSFDHYLPLSTVQDVQDAHGEGRAVHDARSILAHRLKTTHNSPVSHWLGIHGTVAVTDEQRRAAEEEVRRAEAGDYVDVHAWIFSPERFDQVMRELEARGAIGLRVEEVTDTAFGDLEFFAILRKPKEGQPLD